MFYEDYVSDWNVLKSSDFLNSNNFFYNENVKNKQTKNKRFFQPNGFAFLHSDVEKN